MIVSAFSVPKSLMGIGWDGNGSLLLLVLNLQGFNVDFLDVSDQLLSVIQWRAREVQIEGGLREFVLHDI